MKKLILILLSIIMLADVMIISAGSQRQIIDPPVLQYKIINHDKVSLLWSKVDDADKYFIYQKNSQTGRYTKIIETKLYRHTFKNLTSQTEYSYGVVAVKQVTDKTIMSKMSNKVKFKTPVEWFYHNERDKNRDWQSYKVHYDTSGKTQIKFFGFEPVSFEGWTYYIGEKDYKYYRTKDEGISKELLFDKEIYDNWSNPIFEKNYVYLLESERCFCGVLDSCILYRVSLDDKKAEELCKLSYFDLASTPDNHKMLGIYNGKLYYLLLEDAVYGEMWSCEMEILSGALNVYSIDCETLEEKLEFKLAEFDYEVYYRNFNFYNGYLYYESNKYQGKRGFAINRIPIKGGKESNVLFLNSKIISKNKNHSRFDIEFTNGYFYVNTYDIKKINSKPGYEVDKEKIVYSYRVKADGTGLTGSKRPFEWRY